MKLLDPQKITERLFKSPTYLPNTAYDDIRKYLKTNKSVKAFKGARTFNERYDP